jgi:hypothetical protein
LLIVEEKKKKMINEIRAAVEWLTRTMEVNDLSDAQLQSFEWALVEALTRKYTDHWYHLHLLHLLLLSSFFELSCADRVRLLWARTRYQDMPWRGQGYRSILSEDCAHVVDHVLRHAAREAHITDLPYRMPAEAFVIWVDPGDVEVKFLKSHRTEVLYHQPSYTMVPDSSAASHRRSMAATSSSSTRNSYGHGRVRSIEEVDVDGASSLLMPDDDRSMRYKNGLQQQHDYLSASDSAVFVQRGHASPPRASTGAWNAGSGTYTSKSPSKFNLNARPWEHRPSNGPSSWGAKPGFRSPSPVGLAGVV